MNQWGQARTRIEAEIQRKKEHNKDATNFEKARGFVRTNWKTKGYDPAMDPTKADSSTDESEVEARELAERNDKVGELSDFATPQPKLRLQNSSLRASTEEKVSLADFSHSKQHPSSKPSAYEQLATLKAIQAYNSALPKKRQKKDSLPEIEVSNVCATFSVKTDLKKGTKELISNYKQIGVTEGGDRNDPSRYGVLQKQREIQRTSSMKKISDLRRSFESLIGKVAKPDDMEEVSEGGYQYDNPFTSETLSRDISLSIYSTPKKIVQAKEAPIMTDHSLLCNLKGYKKPVKKGEEESAEAVPETVVEEPLLPEFESAPVGLLNKDATDQYRQD